MKRSLVFMLAAGALLTGVAAWYAFKATHEQALAGVPAPVQRVQTVNGETVVTVPADVQRAAQIGLEPVAVVAVQQQTMAYATVIDLQPLFDLHGRVAAARADREAARAHAAASRAQYERSTILFNDDRNVSKRSLDDAKASMQTDQAKLESAEAAQSALEAAMRQQFGNVLSAAASSTRPDRFQRLAAGAAAVLRVTLPAGASALPPDQINFDGTDGRTISAAKFSASAQTDPAVQGNSYLYVTDRAVPMGTRLTGSVPLGGKKAAGLLIPDGAIVWYGGQSWAYVKTTDDHFTRRIVSAASATVGGLVVTSGFSAGDRVVVRGAQLLLSEELRPPPTTKQCKDPPECDG